LFTTISNRVAQRWIQARGLLFKDALAIPGAEVIVPPDTDLRIVLWEQSGLYYMAMWLGDSNTSFIGPSAYKQDAIRKVLVDREIERSRVALQNEKEKRERNQQEALNLKVGDILYSSWGYDQTNVDFYQVTARLKQMVVIREIESRAGSGSQVFPVPNKFIGEPMRKRIGLNNFDGSVYLKLTSYSSARLWDGKPKYQTPSNEGR